MKRQSGQLYPVWPCGHLSPGFGPPCLRLPATTVQILEILDKSFLLQARLTGMVTALKRILALARCCSRCFYGRGWKIPVPCLLFDSRPSCLAALSLLLCGPSCGYVFGPALVLRAFFRPVSGRTSGVSPL